MKYKKKGMNQVDWAMSLGIFIIYLAWFFILVKPQFDVSETPVNLLETTKENLLNKIEWGVEKRPLFVFSDITGENEGIIADFPYSMTNFAFSDNRYFTLDEGRLLFLDNLTQGTNLFWIVSSSKNYSLPTVTEEITASEGHTTVRDLRADFDSGLLDEIYFKNESRLDNFEVYVNNIAIDTANNSFVDSSISGGYKIYTDNINHRCYVLAGNTKIYCFVELGKEKPHDINIKADLTGFTNYYSNNLYAGSLSNNSCESFTGDYVDFYNGNGGLSFIFDKDADIEFCSDNGVSFSAALDLIRNISYIIAAHDGSYTKTLDYKMPGHEWGIKQEANGLDKRGLNQLDYNDLKRELQFPIERDFIIVASNSTEEIFRYDKAEPGLSDNVFAGSFDSWCLDKYSNKEGCTVNIKIW